MIDKIKNPIELFDFINILSLVTPPNRKNKHHFKDTWVTVGPLID